MERFIRIKKLSIESDNGDEALKVFRDQGVLR